MRSALDNIFRYFLFLPGLADDHSMNTRIVLHILDILAVLFKMCPQALSNQSAHVVGILLNLSHTDVVGSKVGLLAILLPSWRIYFDSALTRLWLFLGCNEGPNFWPLPASDAAVYTKLRPAWPSPSTFRGGRSEENCQISRGTFSHTTSIFMLLLETTQAMLRFSSKSIIQKKGNIGIFQRTLK